MPEGDMAEFMAKIMVSEGGWVIAPTRQHGNDWLDNFLDRLRTVPARIWHPGGSSRYRFAERDASGRWFFVWVPDRE